VTETIAAQTAAAGTRSGRRARSTPWLVVGAWMSGVLVAFWFFELRSQGSVRNVVLGLVASDIRVHGVESWFKSNIRTSGGIAPRAQTTIVHFYQAGCACNRAIEPRLADLEERYRTRGVRVVRVERTALVAAENLAWINATPAALVFDGAGKLVYFGPYSDAGWCGASGDLVERALDQSLLGTSQRLRKISARGCFCSSIPIENQGTVS
jgi:hypothetical protein